MEFIGKAPVAAGWSKGGRTGENTKHHFSVALRLELLSAQADFLFRVYNGRPDLGEACLDDREP